MKKFTLSAVCLFLTVFTIAQSGEKNFIDQPYIEVTGTAELDIVPDMIYLNITISESDTKGKISLESLEDKMKQRLTESNVDISKDLTVSDMSSDFATYFLKVKDIVSTKTYVLLLHDATTASKVLKMLSEENISNVTILKVDHSQMAQKRFNLRLEAVKTAKIKAESMAGAIDQKIGKAIFLSEYTDIAPLLQSNVSGVLYMKNREADYAGPELSFKNIQLKSSVTARFILN